MPGCMQRPLGCMRMQRGMDMGRGRHVVLAVPGWHGH